MTAKLRNLLAKRIYMLVRQDAISWNTYTSFAADLTFSEDVTVLTVNAKVGTSWDSRQVGQTCRRDQLIGPDARLQLSIRLNWTLNATPATKIEKFEHVDLVIQDVNHGRKSRHGQKIKE